MMVEVERATGVSVPERDYTKMSTLNQCVAYLMSRMPAVQA
jgi:hypothetical protein